MATDEKPKQLFHLTYDAEKHLAGITKDQIPDGHGACDALVLCSIVYPPDGSFSLRILTVDGRSDEDLPALEQFKVWCLWCSRLMEHPGLQPGKREFLKTVFESWKEAVLAVREEENQCEN